MNQKNILFAAFILLHLHISSVQAVETKLSGFAQITVGRVIGGSPTTGQGGTAPYIYSGKPGTSFVCPCFSTNYEYVGVNEYGKTQFEPETLAAIQGDMTFNSEASATVQAVARTADKSARIDWAYISYKFTPDLTFQAGHKRMPLYYYSDFEYVGYAYPWIRPPQDVYGWQIYAYNGANLMHTSNWNRWAVTSNIWAGEGTDKDNALLGKLYYNNQIEENWKDMIGGYLEASNDSVMARVVYMHTTLERFNVIGGVKSPALYNGLNNIGQIFYGYSLNADYNNFLFRSEAYYNDRPDVQNYYHGQFYSGGYKFGSHTIMLTWSESRERAAFWPTGVEVHQTNSLSYRWDFAKSYAFKAQYDEVKDTSGWLFTGNAKLISTSLQTVF